MKGSSRIRSKYLQQKQQQQQQDVNNKNNNSIFRTKNDGVNYHSNGSTSTCASSNASTAAKNDVAATLEYRKNRLRDFGQGR